MILFCFNTGHCQIPKRWEGNKDRSDGNGESFLQEKHI